jgi:hypothetical protein
MWGLFFPCGKKYNGGAFVVAQFIARSLVGRAFQPDRIGGLNEPS